MFVLRTAAATASLLVTVGFMTGCDSADRQTRPAETKTADTTETSGTTGKPINQNLSDPVTVTMVSPFEFRVAVKSTHAEQPVTTVRGTLTLDSMPDKPILLDQKKPGSYASGVAPSNVNLPAKGKAVVLVDNSRQTEVPFSITQITKVDDPQFSAPLAAGGPPKAIEVKRGFRHNDDEAPLAVLGENLKDAKMFFRLNSEEKEVPVDESLTTAAIVMDPQLLLVVPPGTYDVVLRNAHGESVLPSAYTREQ